MDGVDEPERPSDLLRQIRETRRDRHPRPKGMELLALIEMAVTSWALGAAGLWLLVQGQPLSGAARAALTRSGPGAIGILVTLLVAGSLRSGLHGGPLAPERADVLNLLLAPVERAFVVRPMALRALLASAGGGALLGATLGGVSQSRLGGSPFTWALAGAVAGAVGGLLTTVPAMVVSGRGIGRTWAFAATAVLVGLAIVDMAAGTLFSPASWVGALALWPLRPAWIAVAAVPAVLALAGLALAWAHRCSVEALYRRAGLIELLRFVASMLDVRGLMRTRALLAQEGARSRPWLRVGRRLGARFPVWQRHWRSLLRWPAWRGARVIVLALAATGAFILTWSGASFLLLVAGFLAYMVGLEVLEAWWQAVEHPFLTDLLPLTRRTLLIAHVTAVSVSVALLGAAILLLIALCLRLPPGLVGVGAIGLPPLAIATSVGAAVRGRDGVTTFELVAQTVVAPTQATLDIPVIGVMRLFRVAVPPALVTAGFAPILVTHAAIDRGGQPFTAEVLGGLVVVGSVLLVVAGLRELPLFALERS
jgi:hypothetical protein